MHYYIKIALRSLLRNKLYTGISIVGLTLGFCSAFLIGLYISDELNYDKWLPNYETTYRITVTVNQDGIRYGASPSDTGLWLDRDYPQIDLVTRTFPSREVLGYEDIEFDEIIYWSDPNFFDMFRFNVISGDLDSALQQPDRIVINQRTAQKYFPDVDPIGKYLMIDREHAMRVTAVIEDVPSNTHMRPNIIAPGNAPFSRAAVQDRNPITGSFGRKLWATRTYARISDENSLQQITDDMPAMLERHLPIDEGRKNSDIYQIDFQPIADIHLSSADATEEAIDLSNVYTVSAIALLILLAAAINFINLTTALGLKRAPEIGIRKAVGAEKSDLVAQFMTESFLYVGISAILATVLTYLLLGPFNGLLLRDISYNLLSNPSLALGMLVIIVFTGLLSSIYPSIVFSSYSPSRIFTVGKSTGGAGRVRQILSTLQFSILTILLISSYCIYLQAQFGVKQALRLNSNPILILYTSCPEFLKQSLTELNSVVSVSCSGQVPHFGIGTSTTLSLSSDATIRTSVSYMSADPNFLDLYDIRLLAGRTFSNLRPNDQSPTDNIWNALEPVIISASTARELNFGSPAEALGQIASWNHLFDLPSTFTEQHDAEVIGVFEDFQIGSVRSETPNAAFFFHSEQVGVMSVKLAGQNIPETLVAIDNIWREYGDPKPIQSRFFEEALDSMYRNVSRQAQLLGIYTIVAIIIAILGLIGLAAFVAEKRTKEIAIRKIVGARRLDIIRLLIWQFSQPVLLSNLLAWPLAYYFLNQWLAGFARHIDLHWWMFLGASAVTLGFSIATVFVHAFITASVNPVKALRYE
jgi:putative ABC transport system permease protein